jgi:hypothetical protein
MPKKRDVESLRFCDPNNLSSDSVGVELSRDAQRRDAHGKKDTALGERGGAQDATVDSHEMFIGE